MMKQTMTKQCKKCGQEKPTDQFWSNPKTRDKLKSSCIECTTKYNQEYYGQNREVIKKAVKQRKKLKPST